MLLGRPDVAAVRHPYDQRKVHRAARAPAVPPDMRDQLIQARIREGVVLHLADGPPAGHTETDRRPQDPGLGERRVDAPLGAELVAQARSGSEDAARSADVLAHHEHRVVARELGMEGVVDRLDERQLTHRAAPAARRARLRTRTAEPRTHARTGAPRLRAVPPPLQRSPSAAPPPPRPGSTPRARR